jgi:hypothetical protein
MGDGASAKLCASHTGANRIELSIAFVRARLFSVLISLLRLVLQYLRYRKGDQEDYSLSLLQFIALRIFLVLHFLFLYKQNMLAWCEGDMFRRTCS